MSLKLTIKNNTDTMDECAEVLFCTCVIVAMLLLTGRLDKGSTQRLPLLVHKGHTFVACFELHGETNTILNEIIHKIV